MRILGSLKKVVCIFKGNSSSKSEMYPCRHLCKDAYLMCKDDQNNKYGKMPYATLIAHPYLEYHFWFCQLPSHKECS